MCLHATVEATFAIAWAPKSLAVVQPSLGKMLSELRGNKRAVHIISPQEQLSTIQMKKLMSIATFELFHPEAKLSC